MHSIIGVVFIYIFLQMCVVWLIYRALKNPTIIDVFWPIGLMVSALIYLGASAITFRKAIIGSIIIAWALRLAAYLWYTRIRPAQVDKRYIELSKNWRSGEGFGFFVHFQFQGLLIFMISLVFYLIGTHQAAGLSLLDGLALAMALAGIMGESLADWQLSTFKKQQKKGVCNIGLWNYSRHPNTFFDWLTWVGFGLFAVQSEYGYLAIAPILLLYGIMRHITIPLTEAGSIKSRGQPYINYQKQTSAFFPWFKKKIGSE